MKNLLGVGTGASRIVESFRGHKQYKIYTISSENERSTKFNFQLEDLENPEDFEKSDTKKIDKFLSTIKDELAVFICGGSDSSGLVLKILEPLHRRGLKLEIVYFMPEREVLSETAFLMEQTTRGVLQQYARSGVFEKIILVSNQVLEKVVGSTNIFEYYNQINKVFSDTYYMIDVFRNTKPVISTFSRSKKSSRISVLGLSSLTDEPDFLFFPFEGETEVLYYFGINEEKLKKEENLFRTITDKVKNRISEKTKASFGVYSTEYEEDYIYVEYYSSKIQQDSVDTE